MISSNELFGHEKSVAEYIMEELENRDKQIEKIHNMSFNERKFTIFKLFYNGLNESSKQLLTEAIKKHPFILEGIYPLIEQANEALQYKRISLYNREEVGYDIMLSYNELLKNIATLLKELHAKTSLDIPILFSYLLWNGYLSKNKTYKFERRNKKNIPGLLFADITDGRGVCLNNTEMLKDILSECGYKSCTMANHMTDFMKFDNILSIKTTAIYEKDNIIKKIMNIGKHNHAFNLIEEDNRLYIYDSTNLSLYNITNAKYANIINGRGKNLLFPYISYFFCLNEEEESILDKLLLMKDFQLFYTKEDYIRIGEENIDTIRNNIHLIEDFYDESHKNLEYISEETNKIMIKKIGIK